MATCNLCNQEMTTGASCREVIIDGQIPFGKETVVNWTDPHDKCPDCGVKVGGFHHDRCDIEECPICHGQRLSCDCQEQRVLH